MSFNWRAFWVPTSAVMVLAIALGVSSRREANSATTWSPQAAAKYLDNREAEWQEWDRPHKDRATLCISCHTQTTYGLARPSLHKVMGDATRSASEQAMLASITKRVTDWKLMQPFYSDITSGAGKEVESYNSEAVLNAIILTGYDQSSDHLTDLTRKAFENAWALQSTNGPDAGSWVWQNFDLAPFESKESQYHFAALLAMVVGSAPDNYRSDPKISNNLELLTTYLHGQYEAQPLLNKIVALWASQSFPSILDRAQRAQLAQQIDRLQKPDGGWALSDLGPWGKRKDDSPVETRPDGYATALIVLVEEDGGVSIKDKNVALGIAWLRDHQDKVTGAWTAWSLNKTRDPATMPGKFMSDAATAYAVLALEKSER